MQEDNYFFKLSAFEQRLLDYYDSHPDFVRPVSKRNEALGFIRGGLRDVSITRTSFSWGVPVPWDSGHVFYVWYDALINYLTVAGYGSDPATFAARWGAAHHLIGKDILKFHCVWWPAMCMAAGIEPPAGDLRARLPAHGRPEARQDDDRGGTGRWRRRRARSRSPTCRRWPWPTTSASTRCATTCCARCRSAATATSPTRASWRATTPTWPTTWATSCRGSRRWSTPSAAGSGPACDPASELAPVAAAVLEAATAAWARWAPHEALEETWRLIGAANAELEAAEPWKMEPGPAVDAVLGDALEVLRIVAVLIAPAMPSTAAEVWRRIGVAGDPSAARLPGGRRLGRLHRRRRRGEGGAPVPAAQGLTVAGWFDSHCHVQEEYLGGDEAGATDLEPVLARAPGRGRRPARLHRDRRRRPRGRRWRWPGRRAGAGTPPRAWASIGLHPHEASEGVDEVAALLATRARRRTTVRSWRSGECGLDYYYEHSPRAAQRAAFAAQIALAHAHGLALVIHARDAWADLFDVLRRRRRPRAHRAALLHGRSRRGRPVPARRHVRVVQRHRDVQERRPTCARPRRGVRSTACSSRRTVRSSRRCPIAVAPTSRRTCRSSARRSPPSRAARSTRSRSARPPPRPWCFPQGANSRAVVRNTRTL